MKRKTPTLLFTALLSFTGARAQSTQQPAQQQAAPYNTLDNDPAFKRLPPEQQELVRKIMANVDKAVADERTVSPTALPAPPKTATPPSGCVALPVKKPGFHIPKALQDAISKQAKQVSKQTGVDLDPNAPAQAVNDAQKGAPCPPAPAASKPANK
jgi:hypothetical protein